MVLHAARGDLGVVGASSESGVEVEKALSSFSHNQTLKKPGAFQTWVELAPPSYLGRVDVPASGAHLPLDCAVV